MHAYLKLRSALATLVTLILSLIMFSSISAPAAVAQGPPLPPDQPERGLVYAGLERAFDGPCKGLYRIKDTDYCTHGPDPAAPGVDVRRSVAPIAPAPTANGLLPLCDGDGVSGRRTQVLYVRTMDRPDRYAAHLASFRQWALDADKIYADSAAETGGYRRIRFVHDASCNLIIDNVVLPLTGNIDLRQTITALKNKDYNRTDRKYMIFMDATKYCGIANLHGDDQPGAANVNNSGPGYGRTDSGCWGGRVVAHEHMHSLGAVQFSAPHSSGGGHCVDEYDLMCYSDPPNFPPLQYPCPNQAHDRLFDCNHDDYFNTSPLPCTYLATHWNTADNLFLVKPASPASKDEYATALVRQSDGKYVAAGYRRSSTDGSADDFALARYNAKGSLDLSFGTNGKVITDLGGSERISALVLQNDGRLVALGSRLCGSTDFVLVRYNTDGTLDTSFGSGGKVITDFGGANETATALVYQPSDGKLLAGGYTTIGTTNFALARYNPNGSLDLSFSGDGKVITDFGANDRVMALAYQPSDGSLVAAGSRISGVGDLAPADFALARYNPNGSLDLSFSGDGKLTTNLGGNDRATALVLQNNGRILVGGYRVSDTADFALVRYRSSGTLDSTFDGDGKVITDFGDSDDYAAALALQSDGKIILGGYRTISAEDFALARYNPNGSLDTTFDGDGKVITNFAGNGSNDRAAALVYEPSGGKVVAAGHSVSGTADFALARYKSNGSLDTTFDGDGKVTTNF